MKGLCGEEPRLKEEDILLFRKIDEYISNYYSNDNNPDYSVTSVSVLKKWAPYLFGIADRDTENLILSLVENTTVDLTSYPSVLDSSDVIQKWQKKGLLKNCASPYEGKLLANLLENSELLMDMTKEDHLLPKETVFDIIVKGWNYSQLKLIVGGKVMAGPTTVVYDKEKILAVAATTNKITADSMEEAAKLLGEMIDVQIAQTFDQLNLTAVEKLIRVRARMDFLILPQKDYEYLLCHYDLSNYKIFVNENVCCVGNFPQDDYPQDLKVSYVSVKPQFFPYCVYASYSNKKFTIMYRAGTYSDK